jgi:hypothetical protein
MKCREAQRRLMGTLLRIEGCKTVLFICSNMLSPIERFLSRRMGVDHLQLSSQPHYSAYPLARSCTPALYDQVADLEVPQPGEYPMQQEDAARIRFMRPAGLSKSIAGTPHLISSIPFDRDLTTSQLYINDNALPSSSPSRGRQC